MLDDVRYRPLKGHPRTLFEHCLQCLWKWRIEVTLAFISVMVVLIFVFEFGTR